MHDDKLSPHPSLHQLCKPDLKQVLKSSQALGLLQRILVSLSTAANISACHEQFAHRLGERAQADEANWLPPPAGRTYFRWPH